MGGDEVVTPVGDSPCTHLKHREIKGRKSEALSVNEGVVGGPKETTRLAIGDKAHGIPKHELGAYCA